MANLFSSIPRPKLKRNTFNLSHEVKLTTEFGRLTPIFCEPVVPGDTFKMRTEMFIRVAPLLAPVMHRVNIFTHFFFVPYRLIWSNWERFITGGESGTEEPAYPKLLINPDTIQHNKTLVEKSSLMDYLDFPTCDFDTSELDFNTRNYQQVVDALPFRAYQLIYNEYYRDQNLEQPIDINKNIDGLMPQTSIVSNMLTTRYRKWEKDYFTSALPFTQRGDDTTIGLSGPAKVVPTDDQLMFKVQRGAQEEISNTALELVAASTQGVPTDWYNVNENRLDLPITDTNLVANLSSATATTINELRRAINLQAYKEVLARSGSRYIEVIRGLFGVVSSDARLQRPEFLGGGKTPLMFGEVLQTSETSDNSMLANLAGRGAAAGTTHQFKKFFEEHGLIVGIMSVMPKPAYMQGLPRKWYKFDRLDHYIPQFANIGEQAILNQELKYMYGDDTDPNHTQENTNTFGYTPRYAEYKYLPSRVHGLFKTSLRYWHLARRFGEPGMDAPNLNNSFVTVKPSELDRVFAVYSDDDNPWTEHLWCQLYHNIKATRPMPKFGVPLI